MATKRIKTGVDTEKLLVAETVTAASQLNYGDTPDDESKRKKTKDWFLTGVTDARLVMSGASGYNYEATVKRVAKIGGERALELYCNGFQSIYKI